MVGARYLNDAFKKRVREMVEEGHKDKANKHSAGQILERIESENPNSFSLPSLYVIQNYVRSLLANGKSATRSSTAEDEDDEDLNPPTESNHTEESIWVSIERWLQERLRVNIDAKPAQTYLELVEVYGDALNNLAMKRIIIKMISTSKAKIKSKAWKMIV